MFNYKKLEDHANVLIRRKDKLIKAWCNSEDPVYRRKCLLITIRIDDILTVLRQAYWRAKKHDEEHQRRLANEIVLLSCRGIDCEYGVGMTREIYEKHGEVICEKCGKEMLSEDDWSIKEMLWFSGIYTP